MFGQKYVPRKMTLEKALVGRFRLPRVRPGGKAPNRELPPKSGDITCMHVWDRLSFYMKNFKDIHPYMSLLNFKFLTKNYVLDII